ncbi:MAG: hypothetical protein NTZ16_12490 [Verrucomicrobia bacterium]|nr:hypothetical protein [Verrucomicrobiota bacterium]
MSAQFIVIYGGRGVRFGESCYTLGDHERATIFPSEGDAWYAAYRADFPPHRVTVTSLQTKTATPKD